MEINLAWRDPHLLKKNQKLRLALLTHLPHLDHPHDLGAIIGPDAYPEHPAKYEKHDFRFHMRREEQGDRHSAETANYAQLAVHVSVNYRCCGNGIYFFCCHGNGFLCKFT